MDGLATHGERPLQPHTQLQEKSISRRGVEFQYGHCHWRSPPTGNPGFAPTLSGQVSSTILRASGLKVSRGLPNVDGNAAMIFVLRRGKKRYACHPDPKRERLAPGMNSPHWCLDCGERTRVDSGAPKGRCVHGGSMQSDEVAQRCKLHPASARLRKTFLPVGFLAAPHVSRRYQLLPSSSSGVLSANELRYLRHWRSRGGHRPAGFQMAIRNAPGKNGQRKIFRLADTAAGQIITARSEEKPMAIREIKRTSLLPHRTRAA